MSVTLYSYQLDALERMTNGCVLCGGVGSGKSLTALAYYYLENGGDRNFLKGGKCRSIPGQLMDLYIITTARKRDTGEWADEIQKFGLSGNSEGHYIWCPCIDSWNNLGKYLSVEKAFFIFDEQRVCGSGVWVKNFLKIVKKNRWIMLSATPGDTWSDYIPLFIANGFYKNRTEFNQRHVVFSYATKYPKVDRYLGVGHLERLRDSILVDLDYHRPTTPHHENVYTAYSFAEYRQILRLRWNPWLNEPIANAAGLCYCLRRSVNSDESRKAAVLDIAQSHPKIIIFYNFNYELDILTNLGWPTGTAIAEWNGHRHESIPKAKRWVYLVNYTAGAEGWNCVETDTVVFYSQNYSYKTMEQASGRIDRLNTPFKDLYFYHLKSRASIDVAISRALREKRNFNESKFAQKQ